MATQPAELSLKLLIDPRSRRVLFAEAGKDVVDFLLTILCMPVASIVKLLTHDRMVGSVGSIYKSVETLDEACYLKSKQIAQSLILNPTFASSSKVALLITGQSSSSAAAKYYTCPASCCYSYSYPYCTDMSDARCPGCNEPMTTRLIFVGASTAVNARGFVKGVGTCTVLDDLTVMPTSAVTTVTLLNKFNVKDVSSLEERTVKLGMEEGLELLKVSFQSKTALTDVFLREVKAEPVG